MRDSTANLPILLISDLHLEDARPDITRTLLHFLDERSGQCQALYILGDLFEVWIGDDEFTDLSEEIASALTGFHNNGSEIYLLHGNRDFLIGADFASRCGAQLIQEPHVLETQGEEFLLLHGDSLCTDDVEYMKFRAMVRNPVWQQEFLSQSLETRRDFAREARDQSRSATAQKESAIMDVNQGAVLSLIEAERQTRIIHGHTHRPDTHLVQLPAAIDGRSEATRIVLGDWDRKAWFVEIQEGKAQLEHFPLLAGRI